MVVRRIRHEEDLLGGEISLLVMTNRLEEELFP